MPRDNGSLFRVIHILIILTLFVFGTGNVRYGTGGKRRDALTGYISSIKKPLKTLVLSGT